MQTGRRGRFAGFCTSLVLTCLVLTGLDGVLGHPAADAADATGAAPLACPTARLADLSARSMVGSYCAMALLRPVAAAGTGTVAVLLGALGPAGRALDIDAPDLSRALTGAGLPFADFIVDNADGIAAEQLAEAQAALAGGAKVLIVDPVDAATGSAIGANARAHGAAVVAYDAPAGGARYYVGTSPGAVATLLDRGLARCVTSSRIKAPRVLELTGTGSGTAAQVARDAAPALRRLEAPGTSLSSVTVPDGAPGTVAVAAALRSHPAVNAVFAGDETLTVAAEAAVQRDVPAHRHVAVVGLDASGQSLTGLLQGDECMAAYLRPSAEAQAAAAVALSLRAGRAVPPRLVGAPVGGVIPVPVPLVAVRARTVGSTVLAGGDMSARQLCAGLAAVCRADGIVP